jgi:hypothetical protein
MANSSQRAYNVDIERGAACVISTLLYIYGNGGAQLEVVVAQGDSLSQHHAPCYSRNKLVPLQAAFGNLGDRNMWLVLGSRSTLTRQLV